MAKKLKFALEMEEGVEVRNIEELRENFSLDKTLRYIDNGKLVKWLRDRDANDVADAIEALNKEDSELPKKVCEIFEVEYDEQKVVDMKEAKEKNRKLNILKEYTDDQKFFEAIDDVAFTQVDVLKLLDEKKTTIYLCGDRFSIPLNKNDIRYVGINKPTVVINAKEEINWQEKGISLVDVLYDKEYQEVVDKVNLEKSQAMKYKSTYISFLMSVENKGGAKNCFNKLAKNILNISYDLDDDIYELKNKLKQDILSIEYDLDADIYELKQNLESTGLIGLADKYIREL